ncbi:MAG: SRPBCC family protein [Oculatellaceae cyanobacterium bins.114]|nr:SRPBCC family protein [Oculatellaceae cyanobacterium bins.114]
MLGFWFKLSHRNLIQLPPLAETFQAVSSASVDVLWRKVMNLADVSWHPLLVSTNVPKGLIPKPGLIYQAVSRLFPIKIRIFVEKVLPKELLSVRILALPGIEERVTYRVESTLCGTRVSYSVTLRGWLSPLVWSLIRPYAARVAAELAHAAEQEVQNLLTLDRKLPKPNQDLLGVLLVVVVGQQFVA